MTSLQATSQVVTDKGASQTFYLDQPSSLSDRRSHHYLPRNMVTHFQAVHQGFARQATAEHSPQFADQSYLASRLASHQAVSAFTEAQVKALNDERLAIISKDIFEGETSPSEQRRLRYIRWTLDRINDARHGADIDRLANAVKEYKKFCNTLYNLKQELAASRMNERAKSTRRAAPRLSR